jgi:PAS domain S-box-containing protein
MTQKAEQADLMTHTADQNVVSGADQAGKPSAKAISRRWMGRLRIAVQLLSLGTIMAMVLLIDPEAIPAPLYLVALLSVLGLVILLLVSINQNTGKSSATSVDVILDMFVEKNPEIMFVKNLDSSFGLANEKFHEMVSDPNNIITNIDDDSDLPSFVAARIHQQDLQVIQQEEPMEFHSHYKRDGDLIHLKTVRFPIYDDNHELIAIGGISSDVTDQVRSRRALIENEQLLRTFIESAPDAVLICSENGDIALVNEAAEAVFKFDRSDMLSMSLFDLIKGLGKEDFEQLVRVERVPDHSNVAETRQGAGVGENQQTFPVEYSLAPVKSSDGVLVICMLRNVSEKAEIESQLRQSQKMEAIGKLTGGMAHDFNNLLGIIIGNLALAKRRLDAHDPLIKRIDTAMGAAERGAELTKRMLAVAQRQPLQPEPVHLNEIVREMTKMLPQSLGADIEVELALESDLPPVEVDESAAESMLLNLAINARDAMPQGGKVIIRTEQVSREVIEAALPNASIPGDQYIHVAVADNGTGMGEEALARAFEPFFTTKEKGKGTGLGLAMIYGFVKQSRGYIVLDSVAGSGTTVHIYLPAGSEKQARQAQNISGLEVPFLASQNHTVLVVDDEVDLLDIARAYLEDLGFKVFTAESGKQALEILGSHDEIDVLLSDVVMPRMSGTELVEQARKVKPEISVIYASGYPSGQLEEKAGSLLDAPLVHKPYSRDKLAEQIFTELSRRDIGK